MNDHTCPSLAKIIDDRLRPLLKLDPLLAPYEEILRQRQRRILEKEAALTERKIDITEFAAGHEYFGLHLRGNDWIFREWAPNARRVYLIGTMTDWQERQNFSLKMINAEGVWEIHLPQNTFNHGDLYRLRIYWAGGQGDRIPAYARRVLQDPQTLIFNAQVWRPPSGYQWRHPDVIFSSEPLFVYEVHVGMAQEEEKVGSFREFTSRIIPRIVSAGYNTIQLMAIRYGG